MKTAAITPRLAERYKKEMVPHLAKKFGYKNLLEVPRLKKVVINMGVGEGAEDIKILEAAMADLMSITGQKPVMTRAKKAIANFKIKQGAAIGCKVTLRGARMFEFVDRLVNVALPRIKDFRGVPSDTFDGAGNFAMGLKEQTIFPEIEADKLPRIQGMDIIFVTSAKTDNEARELITLLGMPFKKQG
jgi:large subunit ribosomal protein L5